MLINDLLGEPAELPTVAVSCAPFGVQTRLVLVEHEGMLLAAEMHWPDGSERLVTVADA